MNNVIVVFSNRKSGWLQMQVYLRDVSENAAFKLITNLTCAPYNEKTNIYKLSADEMALVRTVHHTSDNAINKKLAKGTTVEDIYNDISKPDKAKNPALKHFFEQLMENNQKAVSLLQKHNTLPVFFNFSSITSLFDDDAVIVEPELCQPVYEISFEETQVVYKITLYHQGKPIEIQYKNRFINFLPTNPTTFIVAKRLYKLDGCNYRQIEPFTQRNTTIALPNTILKTENNFIIRTIKDFEVIAKGFEIKVEDVLPKAKLFLNSDLSLLPNISMEFDYNGNIALPTTDESVFVSQTIDKEGKYIYTKTLRNKEFELQKSEVLDELGLIENTTTFSVNKFLMVPGSAQDNQDAKSRLFDIIGWINFNLETLQLHGFEIDANLNDQSYFVGKFNIQASAKEQVDWFDMNAKITIGEFEYPFIRFKNHILNHIVEFELPNKSVFIIPTEWFTRFHDLLYYSQEEDGKLVLRKGLDHLFRKAFKNDASMFTGDSNLKEIELELVENPPGLHG